jgi:5-methyltetrahydrofolate--homocysteine methyltransferase
MRFGIYRKVHSLIVGEKINSSIKEVKKAILQRNESFIENLAKNQKLGGADYLEVNSGLRVYPEEEASDLEWLVPLVQKATGLPLCIDTAHGLVLERALKLHQGKAIVNSINGDSERWGEILPLATQYGCDIIALPSDRKGIPPNVEGRIKIAERIIEGVAQEGIAQNRLYFDPLVLPLSSNTKNGLLFIDTLKEVKRVFRSEDDLRPQQYFLRASKEDVDQSNFSRLIPRCRAGCSHPKSPG